MAMVTRWTINDELGRVLTIDEFWSYDTDDAIQFRHEDDALEASALYPGTTVERFQRWSAFADVVPATVSQERTAA